MIFKHEFEEKTFAELPIKTRANKSLVPFDQCKSTILNGKITSKISEKFPGKNFESQAIIKMIPEINILTIRKKDNNEINNKLKKMNTVKLKLCRETSKSSLKKLNKQNNKINISGSKNLNKISEKNQKKKTKTSKTKLDVNRKNKLRKSQPISEMRIQNIKNDIKETKDKNLNNLLRRSEELKKVNSMSESKAFAKQLIKKFGSNFFRKSSKKIGHKSINNSQNKESKKIKSASRKKVQTRINPKKRSPINKIKKEFEKLTKQKDSLNKNIMLTNEIIEFCDNNKSNFVQINDIQKSETKKSKDLDYKMKQRNYLSTKLIILFLKLKI